MREIYHENFEDRVFNGDVAHKVSSILETHNPRNGWKAGQISYHVGERETNLTIPLSKYDEPLEEMVETFTVENNKVNEKISMLAQDGYSEIQRVPSGNKTIVVATKPYTRRYGSR